MIDISDKLEIIESLYVKEDYEGVVSYLHNVENDAKCLWYVADSFLKIGGELNISKAQVLFEKGCEAGYSTSCFSLACLYDVNGTAFVEGVDANFICDKNKAKRLYQKCFDVSLSGADNGNGEDMRMLAMFYCTGILGQCDLDKGYEYYKMSFDHGMIVSANDLALFHSDENSDYYDIEKACYYFMVAKKHKALVIDPSLGKKLGC